MKKEDWTALAAIAGCYAVLEAAGVTCPIKYLTGVSCPGCGMSRAWLSLLRLDVAAAWAYHPLFWLPVPGAVWFLRRRRIPRTRYRWGLGLLCGLLIGTYVIRLLAPGGTIVVFHPQEGLFLRLFRALCRA